MKQAPKCAALVVAAVLFIVSGCGSAPESAKPTVGGPNDVGTLCPTSSSGCTDPDAGADAPSTDDAQDAASQEDATDGAVEADANTTPDAAPEGGNTTEDAADGGVQVDAPDANSQEDAMDAGVDAANANDATDGSDAPDVIIVNDATDAAPDTFDAGTADAQDAASQEDATDSAVEPDANIVDAPSADAVEDVIGDAPQALGSLVVGAFVRDTSYNSDLVSFNIAETRKMKIVGSHIFTVSCNADGCVVGHKVNGHWTAEPLDDVSSSIPTGSIVGSDINHLYIPATTTSLNAAIYTRDATGKWVKMPGVPAVKGMQAMWVSNDSTNFILLTGKASGYGGTAYKSIDSGATWIEIPHGLSWDNALYGIWATGPNSAYAYGTRTADIEYTIDGTPEMRSEGVEGLLHHWDGSNWTKVTISSFFGNVMAIDGTGDEFYLAGTGLTGTVDSHGAPIGQAVLTVMNGGLTAHPVQVGLAYTDPSIGGYSVVYTPWPGTAVFAGTALNANANGAARYGVLNPSSMPKNPSVIDTVAVSLTGVWFDLGGQKLVVSDATGVYTASASVTP